jgi:hypothetical protein
MQALIRKYRENEKTCKDQIGRSIHLKRRSVYWKKIFVKWKSKGDHRAKEEKLSEEQLKSIEEEYNEEMIRRKMQLNNEVSGRINQEMQYFDAAERRMKELMEQRRGQPPIFVGKFDVLRKAKPNTHKRCPLRSEILPREVICWNL